MALNWNIAKCSKELKSTDREWAITDRLIWATMFVGIGEITEKNYVEFYSRYHLIELLFGSFLTFKNKDYLTTLADVKLRIGLRTNAGPWSHTKFVKIQTTRYFRELTNQEREQDND